MPHVEREISVFRNPKEACRLLPESDLDREGSDV
jgi:hypothetical protein